MSEMLIGMFVVAVLFAVFGLVNPRAGCSRGCESTECGNEECPDARR